MDERHKRPGWIPLVHAWHCDGFSCIYSFAGDCNHEWRRRWHPTLLLLPGKSHGRKSLVGYSPWGREESDMTQRPHFHFLFSCIGEGNGNPLQCSCQENPRDGGASKNTGMDCHFLLQCMKVKSESEVAQSWPTFRDPMDCSLPGFSVHGVSQARVLEWVAIGTYKLIIKYLPGRNLLVQRRTWWEKQLILCSVTVIFIMYNWAIYQVWCSHQFPPENQEEISGRDNR